MEEKNTVLASGKSHAKIILIGEHSVVYGQPAIALPLSAVTVTATLKPLPTNNQLIKSSYYDGPLTTAPQSMLGITNLIKFMLAKANQPQLGFCLEINSQLPAERGMGSSAAVTIAIIRAFAAYFAWNLSRPQLLKLAQLAEKETHKNPSGLDAATSASLKPIWLIRNQEMYPLKIALDAYLLIADSGIKGQTKQAVSLVKEKLVNDPSLTQGQIQALGALAHLARKQLAHNDVLGLGQTFNQAQSHLQALGVSSKELDNFISLSLNNGALGAKLTGGGRGGCFICLVKDQATAQNLATVLKEHGVTQTWLQPLTNLEEFSNEENGPRPH